MRERKKREERERAQLYFVAELRVINEFLILCSSPIVYDRKKNGYFTDRPIETSNGVR